MAIITVEESFWTRDGSWLQLIVLQDMFQETFGFDWGFIELRKISLRMKLTFRSDILSFIKTTLVPDHLPMILHSWGDFRDLGRTTIAKLTRMLSFFNRLTQDVSFSEYIIPVCLPSQGDSEEADYYEGTKGLVVGWGWMKNRAGIIPAANVAASTSSSSLLSPVVAPSNPSTSGISSSIPPDTQGL